jgi:hypothetical protein
VTTDHVNAPDPADGIRKLGFKKWYERQLIESHAYLVTSFLCLILVAALFEGLSFRAQGAQALPVLVLIAGGGLVGLASLRRYGALMSRAERFSYRSTCEGCGAYAAFDVVESGGSAGPSQVGDGPPATWLRVRCRKCGHGWAMP